jgi:hypothetical protein
MLRIDQYLLYGVFMATSGKKQISKGFLIILSSRKVHRQGTLLVSLVSFYSLCGLYEVDDDQLPGHYGEMMSNDALMDHHGCCLSRIRYEVVGIKRYFTVKCHYFITERSSVIVKVCQCCHCVEQS